MIVKPTEVLDPASGMDSDTSKDNGIAEYKGNNDGNYVNSEPTATEKMAELWITNAPVTANGSNSVSINSDIDGITTDNGVLVSELAPEKGRSGDNNVVFWQARILDSNHKQMIWQKKQTKEGHEAEAFRCKEMTNRSSSYYQLQYKNENNAWTNIKSSDQIVFYYTAVTNLLQDMIQINITDWPNLGEGNNNVIYEVYVGGKKQEPSITTSYNAQSVQVQGRSTVFIDNVSIDMNEVEKYTVQGIIIEYSDHTSERPNVEDSQSNFSIDLDKGDCTVKIYLERYKYELKYVLNEGSISENANYTLAGGYDSGIAIIAPNADSMSRSGYTFVGWYTDEACTEQWNGNEMPEYDLTLYAKWDEAEKVNVTYTVTSTENPTPVSGMPTDRQVYKGSNVSAGSDPTTTSTTNGNKQGTWRFSGWETNDNQTNVQNDVHYTGRWTFTETAKVNVTYEVTSTENPTPVSGMPTDRQVYKGSNVSAGSDPTTTSTTNGNKQGTWRFSGWETNDNQTNVQNDVHYTGSWTFTEAKKYTITIQYVDDAQTPEKIKADEVITQYDGSKYDVTNKIHDRINNDNNDYVKESMNGSATGTVNGGDVTIIVVYTKDVLVDSTVVPKPDGPGDNIPDKYQVTINYVSSDTTIGRITGRTQEVLTIREDKQPTNEGTVTASGSTATATDSRCYFSSWINDAKVETSTAGAILGKQTIKNAKGGDVYTFTANFDRSSGGGSGGSNRPKPPVVEIPDDVPTGLNGKDHYAYIIGYGNNDVRPQNNITRAEVATIFFRLLTDETREANMTKSNGYNDVKDGDWFCCAVSTLSKMGIIKGYEDGSFKPNDPISRAEFAAIAARFDPDGDKTPATFADVTSHWAKDEISIAANHGWIKGYEDGSFKPDQKITRAETMTLVNRVLNRLPEAKDDLHKDMKTWVDNMDETAWYYLAVQEATNSHYFKNKTGTKFEQWTDLRDTRDWSELEK